MVELDPTRLGGAPVVTPGVAAEAVRRYRVEKALPEAATALVVRNAAEVPGLARDPALAKAFDFAAAEVTAAGVRVPRRGTSPNGATEAPPPGRAVTSAREGGTGAAGKPRQGAAQPPQLNLLDGYLRKLTPEAQDSTVGSKAAVAFRARERRLAQTAVPEAEFLRGRLSEQLPAETTSVLHPTTTLKVQRAVRDLRSGASETRRSIVSSPHESPDTGVFLELDPRRVSGSAVQVNRTVPEAVRALVIQDVSAYGKLRRDHVLNRVFDFAAREVIPEGLRVPVKAGLEPLPEGLRKPLAPNAAKWRQAGGEIVDHGDGSVTYRDREGNAVFYDADGYADFKKSGFVTHEVKLKTMTGENSDFAEADRLYEQETGKVRERGQTWHHNIDGKTMQLRGSRESMTLSYTYVPHGGTHVVSRPS